MPYGPGTYPKSKKAKSKIHTVMGEHKRGTLKSSSGEKVTNRKQAIAIALAEARRVEGKKRKSKKRSPFSYVK